jgi:uncharacterized membrane protein
MSHDNVTPFRPRPKPAQPQKSGGLGFNTHRGKAVLVQILALAAFALNWFLPAPPLSLIGMAVGIAGAALAYSNRGEGMPWAATHHEHALRTLIIGYSIWVLGSLLSYVSPMLMLATLLVHLAVAIWAGLRSIIGLVLAVMRKPIPRPQGVLV